MLLQLHAFQAFGDETHPVSFPDVTYGFYRDFSATQGLDWTEIALRDDFTLDVDAFNLL